MKSWIGVDLDGTLAYYDPDWNERGPLFIGKPISLMIERVKKWLVEGIQVRIVTARVSVEFHGSVSKSQMIERIEQWCEEHIGERLPITNEKDYGMIQLWDDRAIQVEPNTGKRADGGE